MLAPVEAMQEHENVELLTSTLRVPASHRPGNYGVQTISYPFARLNTAGVQNVAELRYQVW